MWYVYVCKCVDVWLSGKKVVKSLNVLLAVHFPLCWEACFVVVVVVVDVIGVRPSVLALV